MSEADPRAEKDGICGVEIIGGTGIVWICIKKVHAKVYERHGVRRGEMIFSAQGADSHYMVPKWPNRENEGGAGHA